MKNVLISGASFAGLSTAYWMNQLGYQVTVVEVASNVKNGGTPVNILENTIDIVKRMGLFDQIVANQLHMTSTSFKNGADETQRTDFPKRAEEYEIERDYLLNLLYDTVKDKAEFIFGDSITVIDDTLVSFKNGASRHFDLIFGCDGIHSIVRKLVFGHENEYMHFLKAYFSITIVNELLIPDFTTEIYSEPGQTILLNTYNGKTDICLCYAADKEVPYDYRNEAQQRQMIYDQFQHTGWRVPELLTAVKKSSSFYFDKLCQIRMPEWTKGHVALVGDAGYCPSPAAGRGGSIAIDGAAALADAMIKYPDNLQLAFAHYNESFRPYIEDIQQGVVDFNLDILIPKNQEIIDKRNKEGFGF